MGDGIFQWGREGEKLCGGAPPRRGQSGRADAQRCGPPGSGPQAHPYELQNQVFWHFRGRLTVAGAFAHRPPQLLALTRHH